MSPRLALGIGSVTAFLFGVPLLLLPAAVLGVSGLAMTAEATSLARGAGATLVGLGVIDWMMRSATGDALRAVLVGNLVVQILSMVVNSGSVATGQLPLQAGSASAFHAVMAAIFAAALRR